MLARYAEASAFLPAGYVMIQEIIPGGGECQLSFASVCRDGDVLAFLTAQRTRQMPPDFGRDLRRGSGPQVLAHVDGAMPFRGETVAQYVRAVDRTKIIRDVYDGSVRPMDGLIAVGMPGHVEDPCAGRCDYDVERSNCDQITLPSRERSTPHSVDRRSMSVRPRPPP